MVIFTKAAASATRVDEVLELHPSIVNRVSRPAQEVEGSPEIAFDAVSFAYPDAGAYSLSDISFTVARGQTLGIIGGTGCGKSTLVNLIPRFYEVSEGSIKVDGVDVRDYPMEQLRGKVGIVPQRAVLFSGTLRQNMQWRKQDATDEEIWQALETAQAASFVRKMPDGLDSVILQGGKNLSGGQKQRLTIARALVGEPGNPHPGRQRKRTGLCHRRGAAAAIAKFSAGRGNRMTTIIVSQRANTVRYARPDCGAGRRQSRRHRYPRAAVGKLPRPTGKSTGRRTNGRRPSHRKEASGNGEQKRNLGAHPALCKAVPLVPCGCAAERGAQRLAGTVCARC